MSTTPDDKFTKPAFTPGPWMVEPHSDTDELINVVSEYQVMPDGITRANWIAELDAQIDFDSDVDEQLERVNANAHLISAAPELYEALKKAVETIRDLHSIGLPEPIASEAWGLYQASPEMQIITAALQKAEGK